MPFSKQKYRNIGAVLSEVYNTAPNDEDLFVGCAAVKEVWALIRLILARDHVARGLESPQTAESALDVIASQFLPDEATPKEKIGDVLRAYSVQVADPDGFAAALLAVLKPEADDEQ